MRILLVDDDGDLLEVMGLLLSEGGAQVLAARSMEEVQARRGDALACELAFLDVNLGSGRPSGVDLCDWLRQEGFAGRVVFLTGHARSHPLVARAAAVAGTRVLSKPISARELDGLIAGAP